MALRLSSAQKRQLVALIIHDSIAAVVDYVNRRFRLKMAVCVALLLLVQRLLAQDNRDTTTFRQRMRLQHAVEVNTRALLLSSIGTLGVFVCVSYDCWQSLFRVCEKWLELPYDFSETFLEARQREDYNRWHCRPYNATRRRQDALEMPSGFETC